MAKHETYQVFNPQNKQFVKMRNGEILENSYHRFEGVPLFGGAPDRPDNGKQAEPENDTASGNNNGAEENKEEDTSGIFEWF